jgi:alkylhydroperoxidase/carboxymuconolactone decarboxylase family protein YurZ
MNIEGNIRLNQLVKSREILPQSTGQTLFQQTIQSHQREELVTRRFESVAQEKAIELADDFIDAAGQEGVDTIAETADGQHALGVVYRQAGKWGRELLKQWHQKQGSTSIDYTDSKGERSTRAWLGSIVQVQSKSQEFNQFTVEQKIDALQALMEDEENPEQLKILELLESIDNRADMQHILAEAGGVRNVFRQLGKQANNLINHLNSMGPEGHKMILDIAVNFQGAKHSSVFNLKNSTAEFINRYVDRNVLSHATIDEKVKLINQLFTRGGLPRNCIDAMSRIGASIESAEDMAYLINNMDDRVLNDATVEQKTYVLKLLMSHGASNTSQNDIKEAVLKLLTDPAMSVEIYKNLGDQGAEMIQYLKAMGPDGCKVIVAMAADGFTDFNNYNEFISKYIDADVLAQASSEDKAHIINCLSCKNGLDADGINILTRIGGSIGSINEMSDVINHIDDDILSSATPEQRSYILKNLTGQGNLEYLPKIPGPFKKIHLQTAITKLLTSIDSSKEMNQVLANAGGIDNVLAKLTDRSQVTELIEHLSGLGEDQDALILDIVRKSNQTDPGFDTSLTMLLYATDFKRLSREERLAVICQISNYPKKEVAENLRRLIHKSWFTDSSLADKQRSLKAIASLTVYPGDEGIIDNTLNRILDRSSNYTLTWVSYKGMKYGTALNGKITLNLNIISADNDRVDFSKDKIRHLITHTIAHEVNHCVNGDRSAKTYEYFLEEYRAYYVGFMAEHGRAPTRAEMAKRVLVFVQDNDVYNKIWDALQSDSQGNMMLNFINRFLGRNDVTRANVAECVNAAKNDHNDTTTAIMPGYFDDMDN